MERPGWAPPEVDISSPAASRIYDYMLGGSHNFAADRALAEQAVAAMPHLPAVLRENRRFLGRAVRHLAGEVGIDQFLDLGSGIPTVGNVHDITAQVNPRSRVVYVDIDPIAVSHSQAILTDNAYAAAIAGDLRQPETVLAHPVVRDLLDLDRPVAVLLVATLHFVADDAAAATVLAQLRHSLAPGSHVAVSHASDDGRPPAGIRDAQTVYARADSAVTMRSRETLTAILDGWELVPPGVVGCPAWRPEPGETASDAHFPGYALVARLPAAG